MHVPRIHGRAIITLITDTVIADIIIIIVCVSVLCDPGNSDISSPSTTNANCSPRWIVYPNTTSDGAQSHSATTQRRCLEACVNDNRCVIAEWNNNRNTCRIHHQNRTRLRYPGVTQFEIVRGCDTTSGTPYVTSSRVVLHSFVNSSTNFKSVSLL